MWQDFNHAWLSLFQKQKDLMGGGLQLQIGQTLINEEGLRNMGKEIVRLCDGIDRHGLVDYEYGVWEENIIASMFWCSGRPHLSWILRNFSLLTFWTSHRRMS